MKPRITVEMLADALRNEKPAKESARSFDVRFTDDRLMAKVNGTIGLGRIAAFLNKRLDAQWLEDGIKGSNA